jgi:hypothetical protein
MTLFRIHKVAPQAEQSVVMSAGRTACSKKIFLLQTGQMADALILLDFIPAPPTQPPDF